MVNNIIYRLLEEPVVPKIHIAPNKLVFKFSMLMHVHHHIIVHGTVNFAALHFFLDLIDGHRLIQRAV